MIYSMIRSRNRLRHSSGFTLVEIMLVVIVIGILAAMVVPRLAGRSDQAREAAARTDIDANIAAALDLFEMDTGAYPTTEEGLEALRRKPSDPATADKWRGPYLKKMPKDPWGNSYVYRYPSSHGMDYDLISLGKDGQEGGGDDVTNRESEDE